MELFESADSMYNNEKWQEAIALLAKTYKVTNMHLERQLARIKRSHSHIRGSPCLERVRCGGFVSEVLTEHLKVGGAHPGAIGRASLISRGVPLRRVITKSKRKSRAPSGFSQHVKRYGIQQCFLCFGQPASLMFQGNGGVGFQ